MISYGPPFELKVTQVVTFNSRFNIFCQKVHSANCPFISFTYLVGQQPAMISPGPTKKGTLSLNNLLHQPHIRLRQGFDGQVRLARYAKWLYYFGIQNFSFDTPVILFKNAGHSGRAVGEIEISVAIKLALYWRDGPSTLAA
jgi:hypothetical protein